LQSFPRNVSKLQKVNEHRNDSSVDEMGAQAKIFIRKPECYKDTQTKTYITKLTTELKSDNVQYGNDVGCFRGRRYHIPEPYIFF